MSSRSPIVAAAAALAAAGLFVATASPAFAAGRTIPEGDSMFVIDGDATSYANAAQGWSVDSTTALATLLPDGNLIAGERFAYQPAYDATTGTSYFVDYRDLDGFFSSLFTFDPATGQSTEVDSFFEGETPINIISMAIGPDGAAYAISDDEYLYSLNLATAELTSARLLAGGPFYGFASDPTSGTFYVVSNDDLYSLDVTTASATSLYEVEFSVGTDAVSLQVDSSGVLWFLNSFEESIELWSATTSEDSELLSGVLGDSDLIFSSALLIIPAPAEPALPATGVDATLPLIAGLGIVTLGGALLLMRRRATA